MIIRRKTQIQEIKNKISELKSQSDIDELKNFLNSDDIEDVLCNQCGNTCKTNNNFEGLIEVIASGGYNSQVIGDETSIKFSLCEKCLGSVINNFKIPPSKRDDSQEFSDFIDPQVSQNKIKTLSIIKK
jgi:predicted molibdopterin-dependent oxidoreductase YjgC